MAAAAPAPAPDPEPRTASPGADFAALARSALDCAGAWFALVEAEVALAQRSLRALLLTALLAPVVVIGFWISVLILLMTALHAAGCNWPAAAAATSALQLIALLWLLRAVRRWARDLSLQRSRELLVRVISEQPQ